MRVSAVKLTVDKKLYSDNANIVGIVECYREDAGDSARQRRCDPDNRRDGVGRWRGRTGVINRNISGERDSGIAGCVKRMSLKVSEAVAGLSGIPVDGKRCLCARADLNAVSIKDDARDTHIIVSFKLNRCDA